MNGDLHILLICHREAVVDGGRGGAPILVKFQTHRTCLDDFNQTLWSYITEKDRDWDKDRDRDRDSDRGRDRTLLYTSTSISKVCSDWVCKVMGWNLNTV